MINQSATKNNLHHSLEFSHPKNFTIDCQNEVVEIGTGVGEGLGKGIGVGIGTGAGAGVGFGAGAGETGTGVGFGVGAGVGVITGVGVGIVPISGANTLNDEAWSWSTGEPLGSFPPPPEYCHAANDVQGGGISGVDDQLASQREYFAKETGLSRKSM